VVDSYEFSMQGSRVLRFFDN